MNKKIEEYTNKLKTLSELDYNEHDIASVHYEADELVLDILRELNCNEAVRYFYKIRKAY